MTDRETVYLDHNATSPLLPCAREALLRVLDGPAGNPSSVHRDGAHARAILDRSRATIASILDVRPDQILFTSGGTESNNLAIIGAARALSLGGGLSSGGPSSGRSTARGQDDLPLLVTSSIEHPSVLACFDSLLGCDKVRRVAPDPSGQVQAAAVCEARAGARSVLVSIQLANHETGALHPVREIAEALLPSGEHPSGAAAPPKVIFHCDAVQGLGKVAVSASDLGVDLLSISAHKLGGPIGIGALFVREPRVLRPLLFGGSQEAGLRPGTASPALAAAFAAAAAHREDRLDAERIRQELLRARLKERLRDLTETLLIQTPEDSVPNTLSFSVPGIDREALLVSLDLLGYRVSAGAACASGAAGPSPVLLAMGRDEIVARSTLRVSLGADTTKDAIDGFVRAFGSLLPRVL